MHNDIDGRQKIKSERIKNKTEREQWTKEVRQQEAWLKFKIRCAHIRSAKS